MATRIRADNEFQTLMDELADVWDVDMNFSLTVEHVPDIERANKTLQERFKFMFYSLPVKMIPGAMINFLALRVLRHLNYFPAATRISKHYSPHTIVSGRVVDFIKKS